MGNKLSYRQHRHLPTVVPPATRFYAANRRPQRDTDSHAGATPTVTTGSFANCSIDWHANCAPNRNYNYDTGRDRNRNGNRNAIQNPNFNPNRNAHSHSLRNTNPYRAPRL